MVLLDLVDYVNLSAVLNSRGRHREAISACARGLLLKPGCAQLYANLAAACVRLDLGADAIGACERALRLDPACLDARITLGAAYELCGETERAIAQLRSVLRDEPDAERAHATLATILLLHGDLPAGLVEQQWHWCSEVRALAERFPDLPAWDGRPAPGMRLLVVHEQGFGDLIQMARYLPALRERVGGVSLESPPEIAHLLRGIGGLDELVEKGSALDSRRYDAYVALMRLPVIFGTTVESIPAAVPYLHADPSRGEALSPVLRGPGLRVGIAWAGNPGYLDDGSRSVPLAAFAALAEVEGIRWFSLQKGAREGEAAPEGLDLFRLGLRLRDYADTAAAIELLDLVISVDTSAAHLAGALAKPVWTLLPRWPDWRWMLDRTDTPWYPTMRLFRQQRYGHWGPAIDEICSALRRLVAERG